MGLLDILNGMQNGPRGPSESRPSDPHAKGGMSPITMAILALLAYKAVKHLGGSGGPAPAPPQAPGRSSVPPSGPTVNAGMPGGGGGWGDMLKGGLGGLLAGGAAGSILSGGLGDLLRQFQQNGHGEVADSWIKPGPNKQISPNDLATALGADQIDALSSQTGLSRSELLDGLSQHLPGVIDQLTPEGRLPTDDEAARWI